METDEANGIRRANWELRYSKLDRDAKGGWLSMMFNLDRDPAWIEQSGQAEYWQGLLDQYRQDLRKRRSIDSSREDCEGRTLKG